MATLSDFAKRPGVEFKHVDNENIKWRFHEEKGKHLALQIYDNHYKNWKYWEIDADTLLTDAYEEIKPVTVKRWLVVVLEYGEDINIKGIFCDKKHAEFNCNQYLAEGYKCEVIPFTHTFKE